MVWQHKPSGYSLTGTIPCTLSDNISHCVCSTTPLFTPTEQSYPAFLFQIPPFSLWEEISFPFPFLRALRWCHARRVSTGPNKPVNLSTASCHHTFLLQKKRPLTPRTWVLSSGNNTATSHRRLPYLLTHGWDGGKAGVWAVIFKDKYGDLLKIKRMCVEAKPLCLTWT